MLQIVGFAVQAFCADLHTTAIGEKVDLKITEAAKRRPTGAT